MLFDSQLQLLKVIDAANLAGDVSSRVSAVYDAAPRKSFVAAMKDIPEIWEISYDPDAKPIFDGYVHDYKMGEGVALAGYLNPVAPVLEAPLDDFFFNQKYDTVMGASRDGKGQVVNLDVRRKIADLDIPGMPHLGSGITWEWHGHRVLGTPNLKEGLISIIDLETWKTVKTIRTLGPGFFMRSHEDSPYAWTDSMMSPSARDTPAGDRQADPRGGRTAAPRARQDLGARGVRPRWPLRDRQSHGEGRCADLLRCKVAEGNQAPAGFPTGREIQPLQQDQPFRGYQPLMALAGRRRWRSRPGECRTRV